MPLNRGNANNYLSFLQEHSLQLIKIQTILSSHAAIHLINALDCTERLTIIYWKSYFW